MNCFQVRHLDNKQVVCGAPYHRLPLSVSSCSIHRSFLFRQRCDFPSRFVVYNRPLRLVPVVGNHEAFLFGSSNLIILQSTFGAPESSVQRVSHTNRKENWSSTSCWHLPQYNSGGQWWYCRMKQPAGILYFDFATAITRWCKVTISYTVCYGCCSVR